METPEFDIADAFAKTDRAEGLGARLGKRPPRQPRPERPEAPEQPETAPQEPAQGPPAAEVAPDPGPASDAPARPVKRPAARKSDARTSGRLIIALPIGLRDRARAHSTSRGETYLDVILAAVQDVHPRLSQLIEKRHQGETEAPTSGGLFEHQPRRKRATEATAQVTIRGLTPHDRGVLEDLVTTSGAANLTELITVALDEHLPQRPRSLR